MLQKALLLRRCGLKIIVCSAVCPIILNILNAYDDWTDNRVSDRQWITIQQVSQKLPAQGS